MKRATVAVLLIACGSAPATGGTPPRTPVDVETPAPVAEPEAPEVDAKPAASAAAGPACPPPALFVEAEPPERIEASHILIAYAGAKRAAPETTRTKQQARAVAEELLQRLCGGAKFSELAEQHSDDPGTRARQGNLGWFRRGQMVRSFEDAAFALVPGQISGVVESVFGYHIISRTQ